MKPDSNYIEARNKLIPDAENIANAAAGEQPDGKSGKRDAWCDLWNRVFHTTMNIMAKEAGLCG